MSTAPSPNGSNGRGAGGRFAKGNVGGPGNPHAQKVAQLRSALLRAVSSGDLRAVVKKLVEKEGKGRRRQAAKWLSSAAWGRRCR
jgi:hypothetical protein